MDQETAYMEMIIPFMKEGAWQPDEPVEGEEPPEEEEEVNVEELIKEISLEGTADELFNRICTVIDPFYPKENEEESVRNAPEIWNDPEDNEKEVVIEPVPWGEFGPYCPVTFIEDNWLVPGNEEIESYVYGCRYRFYNEQQKKKFKRKISFYTHQ